MERLPLPASYAQLTSDTQNSEQSVVVGPLWGKQEQGVTQYPEKSDNDPRKACNLLRVVQRWFGLANVPAT